MPDQTTVQQPSAVQPDELSLGDADPTIATLEDVYLDGTLVLVGCGKAKRDPEDPTDLHLASVGPDEEIRTDGPSGPAWKARDLYTSTYFSVKREFAETVTQWSGDHEGLSGWAVLSAEHKILHPWEDVKPYDTTIDDIGGDPTNEAHHVRNNLRRRRPDGQEMVTEMDQWAAGVAYGLGRWLGSYRERGAAPFSCDADTLLVLAGQQYVEPLRERGVFEYGISRMAGDVNDVHELPVRPRYLFEEIDADGIGEQMAWLSDAVDRLDHLAGDSGEQVEVGEWTGEERACSACEVGATDADLAEYDGVVYCEECKPIGRCGRCDDWTHETGLGTYPLCPDCQTEYGGQIREPLESEEETTEETEVTDFA